MSNHTVRSNKRAGEGGMGWGLGQGDGEWSRDGKPSPASTWVREERKKERKKKKGDLFQLLPPSARHARSHATPRHATPRPNPFQCGGRNLTPTVRASRSQHCPLLVTCKDITIWQNQPSTPTSVSHKRSTTSTCERSKKKMIKETGIPRRRRRRRRTPQLPMCHTLANVG